LIAYVKGILEEIAEGNAVVDVGGIGYNIKISMGTMGNLPPLHHEVKFYTYTYVREDTFSLYGFLEKEDLRLFQLLITVNGVGPKGALGILSVMSGRDLRFAIVAADSKMISKAPGIGKKTAERVILDLRDKVSIEDDTIGMTDSGVGAGAVPDTNKQAAKEAVEALVALGYGSTDAVRAVNQVANAENSDVEAIIKAALKVLF